MPNYSLEAVSAKPTVAAGSFLLTGLPPRLSAGAETVPPTHAWSVDFTRKRLDNGQSFTCCNVLDVTDGRWLASIIRSHFNSGRLIDALEAVGDEHGLPALLQIDHLADAGFGDLVRWAFSHGITVIRAPAGKPHVRSCRVPLPTSERWRSIANAQQTVDTWRRLFNARVPMFRH